MRDRSSRRRGTKRPLRTRRRGVATRPAHAAQPRKRWKSYRVPLSTAHEYVEAGRPWAEHAHAVSRGYAMVTSMPMLWSPRWARRIFRLLTDRKCHLNVGGVSVHHRLSLRIG